VWGGGVDVAAYLGAVLWVTFRRSASVV